MNTSILKKAVITEKSFKEAAAGKFTFIVDKKSTKEEVAACLEELFGVHVEHVDAAIFKGKIKRTKKGSGKRSDFKKAIVTLRKGEKIDLFEIEKEETKPAKSEKAKAEKKSQKAEAQKEDKDTTVKVRNKAR